MQSGTESPKILFKFNVDVIAMVMGAVSCHTIWQIAHRLRQTHDEQVFVSGHHYTVRVVSNVEFENRFGGRRATLEIRVPVHNGVAILLCRTWSASVTVRVYAVVEYGGEAVMGDEVNRVVEATFPAALSQLIGQKHRSHRYRIKVVAVFFNLQPAVNDVYFVIRKQGVVGCEMS